MDIVKDAKTKMQAALDHLQHELKSLRTGRANPSILDSVEAEVYGQKMRLKALANITAPEMRLIVVTPYEPSNVGLICKAIEKANLNLQPVADKNMIRITIPPMDAGMRAERVKQARKKGEEAKIAIRAVRRDGNEYAKQQKSRGDIAEDMLKKLEKQIQELTDKFCKEIDASVAAKEKDILEI